MSQQEGQKTVKSGVAMVRISGAVLRSLREQQGLTQLYLATAVEVTTETISRWERQQHPTLKEENGLKLAEVLGVSLQDLYGEEEKQDEKPPAKTIVPLKKSNKKYLLIFALVSGIISAAILALFLLRKEPVIAMSATRHIPLHSTSGQIFPVLIRVEDHSDSTNSLLLKEQLPVGCSVVQTMPEATAKRDGFVKWVVRDDSTTKTFAYLAQCGKGDDNSASLLFEGSLLVRNGSHSKTMVAGRKTLTLSAFHWADLDKNNVIDDEELLTVYDEYALVEGLHVDVDQVESIWMGSGYVWNTKTSQYEIIP